MFRYFNNLRALLGASFFFAVSGLAFPAGAQVAIEEVRIGGAILDTSIYGSQSYYNYDRGGVDGEVLFSPFNFDRREGGRSDLLNTLLTPRLHVGGTVAFDKDATSSVYAGLTWHQPLTARLFVEGSFGAAVHDGFMRAKVITPTKERRGLGSPVLFRESIALGVVVNERVNLVFAANHMSHAMLAGDENAGQSNLTFKIGFKF